MQTASKKVWWDPGSVHFLNETGWYRKDRCVWMTKHEVQTFLKKIPKVTFDSETVFTNRTGLFIETKRNHHMTKEVRNFYAPAFIHFQRFLRRCCLWKRDLQTEVELIELAVQWLLALENEVLFRLMAEPELY